MPCPLLPAPVRLLALAAALAQASTPGPALAQMHHGAHAPADSAGSRSMPGMKMPHRMTMPMESHAHPGHGESMRMGGMLGPYPMTREASGTSWQPDAAPHLGLHAMRGPWMLMVHGNADLVLDRQGGDRGGDKLYSSNMLMGMAQRPLGPGTFGARAMLSAEPATIGREGYPLLLQTGETADGRTPLVDRQHPHDFLMELAGAWSVSRGRCAAFVYGGLPGEPALGPPAFMHRFSGMAFPVAPITHHWLDSSHISWGVLTGGLVLDRVKLEASAFRGREPDQHRWDFETPKLDSHSFRLSANPVPALALQVSYGRLKSPEQLDPQVGTDRTTASAMVDGGGLMRHWEATLAWGRNRNHPGHTLDAFTAEGALALRGRHTLLARAETVEKDELFLPPDPRAGRVFQVGELSAGYRFDFPALRRLVTGIGALGTVSQVPEDARSAYGSTHPLSGMVFLHAHLR